MKAVRCKVTAWGIGVSLVCLGLSMDLSARSLFQPGSDPGNQTAATPAYFETMHQIGKLVLTVTNHGTFGNGYQKSGQDSFTGEALLSCEFPKGSRTQYLFVGTFWIGAVVGRDTLVSHGADGWDGGEELHPDFPHLGDMKYRSIIDPSAAAFEDAVSEEDFISVYYDTCVRDCLGLRPDRTDNRAHLPLHMEITERSFAWSYKYAENFVLFDYAIKNIGRTRLKRVYMGIYVDADVLGLNNQNGYIDDICGFRRSLPAFYSTTNCSWDDTINIAWIADNDGDLTASPPVPNVTGTRIIRTPSDSLDVSFNWWVSNSNANRDFGPRHRTDTRSLGTGGNGTPTGDRNKYWYLRNKEFDYDQVYTAVISPMDTVWQYPPEGMREDIADGFDTRYLLSFGPFDIEPGQTLPLSFAYVGGERFHYSGTNLSNLPNSPDQFYRNIDFSNLGYSSIWSSWIYDNPGYDTDTDGYAGKNHICNAGGSTDFERIDTIFDTISVNPPVITMRIDTIWRLADTVWYEGDGVPDFQGASPPPAPTVWVYPSVGTIRVRFNGLRSETTRDVFSHALDFEGYRVYYSRDDRRSSFTLLTSYDLDDFSKYTWIPNQGPGGDWVLKDIPFTRDSLRCLYAPGGCTDSLWPIEQYTRSNPFHKPGFSDSIFFFVPQDFNKSVLGVSTPIRKIYPTEPYPSTFKPDSAQPAELTPDGYFKYFEYEYILTDLLPTVPYFVNVTAFDFGSPKSGLSSLESPPNINPKTTYAMESADSVVAKDMKVFIYPNPYRIDGNYRAEGFEGRGESDRVDDRVRRIHFANLPPKCTIRLFTIDGDLIREIIHDIPAADPLSNHDVWDLITRNTQLAVSGLYYWTVESPGGQVQMGKLVLIM